MFDCGSLQEMFVQNFYFYFRCTVNTACFQKYAIAIFFNSCMVEKALFLGQIFEIEILMNFDAFRIQN